MISRAASGLAARWRSPASATARCDRHPLGDILRDKGRGSSAASTARPKGHATAAARNQLCPLLTPAPIPAGRDGGMVVPSGAKPGRVALKLYARNNGELASVSATPTAARIPGGWVKEAAATSRLPCRHGPAGDFNFSKSAARLDLSDRGVSGGPARPVDAFPHRPRHLSPRGVYLPRWCATTRRTRWTAAALAAGGSTGSKSSAAS